MQSKPKIYSHNYVKNLFNEMSKTYGIVNFLTSFGLTEIWRRVCINRFSRDVKGNHRVLDLMTGMGEMLPHINSKFNDFEKVLAIDFSKEMCLQAQRTKERFPRLNCSILEEDIFKTNIKPESIDFITCSFGLKTLSREQQKSLAVLVKDALKTEGEFSFIEISVPSNTLIKTIFTIYLKIFIPILGKLFLGNPDNYRHLAVYTIAFGNSKKFYEDLASLGLKVKYFSHFFGCATGVSGTKVRKIQL